jgi:hypothetical protein
MLLVREGIIRRGTTASVALCRDRVTELREPYEAYLLPALEAGRPGRFGEAFDPRAGRGAGEPLTGQLVCEFLTTG